MPLEQVGLDEVMAAMAERPEVWVRDTLPELRQVAALLQGENMRRALETVQQLGFVVAKQVPDASA